MKLFKWGGDIERRASISLRKNEWNESLKNHNFNHLKIVHQKGDIVRNLPMFIIALMVTFLFDIVVIKNVIRWTISVKKNEKGIDLFIMYRKCSTKFK